MKVSCPHCQRSFDASVRFCPIDGAQVQTENEDPHLGLILLDQFELREVCGRGAMGTVYRAYQRTVDRVVAVKILRPELLRDEGVLRRFLREARAAARLQHPNIVTIHMVGETLDGAPYLVMEHVEGVALETICEAQGALGLERTLHLGEQIASALAEAHHLGIVHRDLKPANILVTDRFRIADQVKVLDFGIAKLLYGEQDGAPLTADGTIFGTPHYLSPEQAAGTPIDHRADLYALGVILFRLATGALPFDAPATMQVVLKHLREPAPRPRALCPELPVAFEQLILDLLAKSPADRPRDAEAVLARLQELSGGARLHSGRTPWPARAKLGAADPGVEGEEGLAPPGRRPAAVVAVLIAIAAGSAVGVMAGLEHNRSKPAPSRAAPSPVPRTRVVGIPAPRPIRTPEPNAHARSPSKSARPARHSPAKARGARTDELPVTIVPSEAPPPIVPRVLQPAGPQGAVGSPSTAGGEAELEGEEPSMSDIRRGLDPTTLSPPAPATQEDE